jgi:diguanylate cyclase (GGDEF)-like protein
MSIMKKFILDYDAGELNHKITGLTLSVIFLAVIGVLDIVSGFEMASSFFYLLPVTIAVIMCGRRIAFAVSFLSAGVWLAADIYSGAHYSRAFIPYWNAMTRMGYYVVHTFLLSLMLALLKEQRQLAVKDHMTGVYNGRMFEEILDLEIRNSGRTGRPVTLCYMDIDDFKAINDTFGHSEGDKVLKAFCKIAGDNIRSNDVLARVGGDEFVILFRETALSEGKEIMERVTESLSSLSESLKCSPQISAGLVNYIVPPRSANAIMAEADKLMYEAKGQGKNRIICREIN